MDLTIGCLTDWTCQASLVGCLRNGGRRYDGRSARPSTISAQFSEVRRRSGSVQRSLRRASRGGSATTSLGRPAARFDATTSSREATGTSTAASLDDGGVLTEGCKAVGESVRGETQIERTMLGDQGHQHYLAEHVGMGLKRDAVGFPRNPEPCTEFDQRGGEPLEVGINRSKGRCRRRR